MGGITRNRAYRQHETGIGRSLRPAKMVYSVGMLLLFERPVDKAIGIEYAPPMSPQSQYLLSHIMTV